MASLSSIPLVEFVDVLDQYSFNADLTCKFKFNSQYKSRGRDNVAIFKLGWTHVTEYVAIKGVPESLKHGICSITFSRYQLPKNISDLYQICYISGRDLHGASTPFQFCVEDIFLATCDSLPNKGLMDGSITKWQVIADKDLEINRLKEENNILRESLKSILANKTTCSSKSCDEHIKEFKDMVESLRCMCLSHDKDITMLKNKIIEGGEEYKRLYLQKYRLQKKYEKLKGLSIDKKAVNEDGQVINDFNFDLGDLISIPPFPCPLNQ